MRRLVAVTQMTLDGVMQAPGGPEEDPTEGFEQGGWSVGYFDDVLGAQVGEAMASPFDLVLGRKTYEMFAAHWPFDEGPIADRMNAATKHVASRTLESLDWRNSHLIEGDVAAAVPKLKEQDGPEPSATSPSGVIIARYEPAGEIQKGSFAFEEPTEREVERRESLGES